MGEQPQWQPWPPPKCTTYRFRSMPGNSVYTIRVRPLLAEGVVTLLACSSEWRSVYGGLPLSSKFFAHAEWAECPEASP